MSESFDKSQDIIPRSFTSVFDPEKQTYCIIYQCQDHSVKENIVGDDWGEPIALDKVKLTSEAPLASAYNPNGSIESEGLLFFVGEQNNEVKLHRQKKGKWQEVEALQTSESTSVVAGAKVISACTGSDDKTCVYFINSNYQLMRATSPDQSKFWKASEIQPDSDVPGPVDSPLAAHAYGDDTIVVYSSDSALNILYKSKNSSWTSWGSIKNVEKNSPLAVCREPSHPGSTYRVYYRQPGRITISEQKVSENGLGTVEEFGESAPDTNIDAVVTSKGILVLSIGSDNKLHENPR